MTGRPSGRCAATEALEFYAESKNWTQPTSWGGRIWDEDGKATRDGGKVARAALASPCCVSAADQEQVREVHRLVVEADLLVSERNIGRQDYRLNKIEDALDRAALILLALLGSNEELR